MSNPIQGTIAILGGGAAGMMAAVTTAEVFEHNKIENADMINRVLLFEKNAYLGAKVLISGGGRCNVTTGIFNVRKLLENYPRGNKFLMSAMFRFPPEKVKEWFESHGVPLKMEDDLRIFPVSNNGKDVVGALENAMKELGVEVFTNANVVEVTQENMEHKLDSITEKANDILENSKIVDNSKKKFVIRLKDSRTFEADAVIITTGGNAYRHTGSTGDGYAFAKNFGHTITPLSPSLNSFIVSDPWIKKLAGVSFEKVGLTLSPGENLLLEDEKSHFDIKTKENKSLRVYKRTGPIVFTHHGVSGPAVFAMSAQATHENYAKEKPMELRVNFFPDESADTLEKRFMLLADQHGKKSLMNFLDMFLPKSACEVIIEVLKADPQPNVGRLSKILRAAVLKAFREFTLHVVGRGAGDEFVTAGGVALGEVNTNTMESKKCPGLYFAGEILDIDGFTGGFNLQASWATGRLAGENASKPG